MSFLYGKRVVVTRAAEQVDTLTALLLEYGAIPLAYHCLSIHPPVDSAPLREAIADLAAGRYDWLILTSPNAAHALRGVRVVGQVATIGPATAQAAHDDLGVQSALIPPDYSKAGLAAALRLSDGARVLLPTSDLADESLARALENMGAIVRQVVAYRVGIGAGGVDLRTASPDALTFTSPSAIRYFVQRVESEGLSVARFADLPCACIGGTTGRAAQAAFARRVIVPKQQTLHGMVAALDQYSE